MNFSLFISASENQGRWQAYLVLFLYIALIIGISIYSRKKAATLDSFLLGNRSVGGWLSAFGYGTTYFSAVVFIGYAGTFGMSLGLGGIWIGIANALIGSLAAWLVLAKKTREVTHKLNAKTMPDFFGKRYLSPGLRIFSSIIIFIFLIPYSTSVYQGIGYIFEAVFAIKFEYCVIIMAILTAVYIVLGGYLGNAISNFAQGIIMLLGVVIIIILMLISPEVNGFEGLRKLSETGYGLFPSTVSTTGNFLDAPATILFFNIMLTSFGVWAVPQSVQKFYAIKDNAAVAKGSIISTVFAFVVGVGAYFNGSFSRLFYPVMPSEGGANIIPNMFLQNDLMGFAVLGLICVLVLAASMSTLSSVALVSASSIGVDTYKAHIKKEASEKSVKLVVRVFSGIFVLISAILAIFRVDAIVTLMSLSWGTLAGSFIGPYIYGLYCKKATKVGGYISMTTALVTTVTLIFVFGAIAGGNSFVDLIKLGIKRAPIIGVICMVLSMALTPIGFFFDKKLSNKAIDTEKDTSVANQQI